MKATGTRAGILTAFGLAAAVALGASTHQAAGAAPGAPLVFKLHEVDTSVVPVDNAPKGPSAGDLLMFTAAISSGGKAFGRYVGNCAYVTKTEVYCSVDMNVSGQGRIELAGEFSTEQADSALAVTGGTGRFVRARGYLTNHQSSTGNSADQVLYVYLS